MLISPAEHNFLAKLGKVSSVPERYGADFLLNSADLGSVGVQRKEVNDLIASVRDGRLAREVAMMKALGQGVFVIEGELRWTSDGVLLSRQEWTRAQHYGVLWSLSLDGYWIFSTASMEETFFFLSTFTRWLKVPSSKHRSTRTRPGPIGKATWGKADNRDWGVHILQGFDGIGYDLACRIWDKFNGLPLRWDVSAEELSTVAGIGKIRAERLIAALTGVVEESTTQPKETAEWLE